MTQSLMALVLSALALSAPTLSAHAQTAPPLVVCMADDNPPLSRVEKGEARGLDLRIAQAVATQLGRPLKVQAFESEFEGDSQLTHEVNAMLSLGLCDAASGFPLLSADLGAPSRPTARPPGYPGGKRSKRDRPFVPLGTLVASRAYSAALLGVVLRDPAQPLAALTELGERRLGVLSGTLAGSVALMWRNGALRSRLVSLSQNEDMLSLMSKDGLKDGAGPSPQFDAAMMPLALFDGWKLRHPASSLTAAQWRRPIGVNFGFVTLSGATEVRAAIDAAIVRALDGGANSQMARWAAEEGMSWAPPIAPDVGPGPTIGDLGRLAGD